MAKRYYVVPIVQYEEDGIRKFRADLPPEIKNYVAAISLDASGNPTRPWALVRVAAKNHLPILARSDIDALPDFPLDAKMSAMQQATKSAVRSRLQARGIALEAVDNADGFRDVVRAIGREINPNFHEENFDVSE